MQINIDEFNALIDKRLEMSEEICALRSKLQRAEEEILMLKEFKAEQDMIVEELKLKLEKKEARIMELTDIIAKSTQNVNVFAVITDKNMLPLALEKFDRTFHGLPEDLQLATAGVVMKSLPTELPPGEDRGHVTVPHKNIISNVTKNEEAGHGPVRVPRGAHLYIKGCLPSI